MGLTLVVIEEHTRRTVELGNNNALGTVDNEGTVLGHQGHFAHVDFLLFNVLDRLVGRFLIVNDKTDFHAQRRCIGYAPKLAFLDIKNRLANTVTDVFERGIARVTDNREYGFECCVKTGFPAVFRSGFHLEEVPERIQLNRQQIGDVHHGRQFTKIFANPLFLSVGVSHLHSPALDLIPGIKKQPLFCFGAELLGLSRRLEQDSGCRL